MRSLFPEDLKRQLKLFEIISTGGEFTQDFLEKQMQCTSRTLKNDLLKLSTYINDLNIYWKGPKGGITVKRMSNFLEASSYQAIMKKSIEITYLEKVFIYGYQKIEDTSDELFISESAVKRMIKKINHTLKRYGLKISGGKIVAEDPNMLTIFITRLLFEKYQLYEKCFPKELCCFFQDTLKIFTVENELETQWKTIGIREKNYFLIYITCCFLQIQNGLLDCKSKSGRFKLEKTAEKIHTYLQKTDPYPAKEYAQRIFKEEVVELFFKKTFMKETSSFVQTRPCLKKLSELIDKISQTLEISCPHKENILNNCSIFFQYTYANDFLLYDQNYLFLEKIERRHPAFFNTLRNKLEKIYAGEAPTELIHVLIRSTLIALVVSWEELLRVLDKGVNSHGLLIMDGTRNQVDYICQFLRYELGESVEIKACYDYPFEFEKMDLKEIEFIITNIPMLSDKYSDQMWEFFMISAFPTNEEVRRIKEFCKQYKLQNELKKVGF